MKDEKIEITCKKCGRKMKIAPGKSKKCGNKKCQMVNSTKTLADIKIALIPHKYKKKEAPRDDLY